MDLLQRARDLYVGGRMHDALEAAQAACDRAPKNPEAWWLLGRVSRHTGLPAASDEAFRRAQELDGRPLPHRVSGDRFRTLIEEARAALPGRVRHQLEPTTVRVQAIPSAEQVRSGVDPDALTLRERSPSDVLVLFQVNHENHSSSEEALRALVTRSLGRA